MVHARPDNGCASLVPMKTPENEIASVIKSEAKKRGLMIRKLRWEGRLGAPDHLILHAGRAYFVETKAPGEKPRASQVAEFTELEKNGFPVAVVDSREAAKLVIERICGE